MNTRTRRLLALLALIVGAVIGFVAGSSIHYQTSRGGLSGALAAGMSFAAIAIVVVLMGVTALVAGLTHRRGALVIIGAIAVGLVSGGLLGTLVGPTYREPLTATGSVKVVFTTPTTAAWNGTASCTSVENGTAIASIREYGAAGPSLGKAEFRPDRRTGSITFTDLALITGPPLPQDPPTRHLAGRVEWSCRS